MSGARIDFFSLAISISILIMGQVIKKLNDKLAKLECHRSQTRYKLSYTSKVTRVISVINSRLSLSTLLVL